MKKLFMSMMLLVMCISMSAATTVLFEGKQTLNWSDGVQIEGSKFADAQVGDIIVVTTENGGFKLALNTPWTELIMSDETTGEYTITDGTLADIQNSGVRVQGGESVNLLKVELKSDAPAPAEKTVVADLLNEPANIGNWDNTIEIAGSAFADAGAKAGDYVRINYSAQDDSQIQLCANSPAWHNILDCTNLNAAKTVLDFQLTEEMVTDIEADKLCIQGKNFTLNSVQLVREGTETAIGSVVNKGNADNNIYSIDGKSLNSKPQHGMYIMNGKKFMAR